ncbi:hypothetical protein ACFX5U_09600 [Sphingobacterium sp. SG20118]|uniref:hypothetical protein n=1 Tax=Sphingobacterium sp. SG20118 TaxID=3367156 RepID=UPI0037DFC022
MYSIGLILMYLIWGGFVAMVLYGLYKVLSALLTKYLYAKNDYTAAIREQNEALKEIAAAIIASKDNNASAPEIL